MSRTASTRATSIASVALLMEECLDAVTFGVMVVAKDGSILFMNAAAAELICTDAFPPYSSNSMNIDSIPLLSLKRRIRRALALPSTAQAIFNGANDGSEVDIVAYPAKDGGKFIFVRNRVFELTDRFVSRTQQIYGLTPQEARIAQGLSSGKSVEEISARLLVQQNTVRMHLKSIYEKTGTTCQSQLVSRLVSHIFLTAVA